MISKSEREQILFTHKTLERLTGANACHNIALKLGNLDKDRANTIKSAKYLFRDFLGQVIDGSYPISLPPSYPLSKVREAYTKSDFDWTDRQLYKEFQDWFTGKP